MKKTNKLWLALLLTVLVASLLAVGFTAAAEDPEIVDSGTNWTLDSNGLLRLNSTGGLYDALFEGRTDVINVVIPDGEVMIDAGMFAGCSNLKSIAIPTSVEIIEISAFDGCSALSYVFYSGTPEQWDQIWIYGYLEDMDDAHAAYAQSVRDHLNAIVRFNTVDWGYCGGEGDGTNLVWALDSEGTLTISGTGAMKSYLDEMPPWYDYADLIRCVILEDGVTTVGDAAFVGCANLIEATMPDSVERVGMGAFSGCQSLKSVDLSHVTKICHLAFAGCAALNSVNLTVCTDIEDSGFTDCTALSQLFLSEPMNLGPDAFYGCPLTDIFYTGSEAQWAQDIADKFNPYYPVTSVPFESIRIHYNVVDWGYCGGEGDGTNIVWVLTNDGTLTISGTGRMNGYYYGHRMEDGFYSTAPWWNYHDSIQTLKLEEGITFIGVAAFRGCSSIKAVVLPVSLTRVQEWVFSECDAITDVFYGGDNIQWYGITYYDPGLNKDESLANGVYGVGSLPRAHIHYNVVDWGYCGGEGDGTNIVWVLTNDGTLTFSGTGAMKIDVVHEGTPRWLDYSDLIRCGMIEDGVKTIGEAAFYGCSNLSEVTLPDSVEKIDMYAFWGCQSLKSIDLSHVTDICHYAFIDCAALKSVTLTKCSFIADAFMDCTSLSKLFLSEQIRTIYVDAFYNCPLTDIFFTGSEAQWAQGIGGAFDPSTGVITVPADSIRIHYNVVDWGYCGAEGDGTNLVWCIDKNSTLTVSGTGAMANYSDSEPAPWSDYFAAPGASITVVLEEGVTTIGTKAFPNTGLNELIVLNKDCDLTALEIRDPAVLRGYLESTAKDYADKYDKLSTFKPLCEVDYRHTVEVIEGVDSTCMEPGHTPGLHCVECNNDFYGCEALPLENHAWGDWVTTKQPTTETEGVRTRTCTTPGCGETETQTIEKLTPTDNGGNDNNDSNDNGGGFFGWLQQAMKGLVAWFKKLLQFFK